MGYCPRFQNSVIVNSALRIILVVYPSIVRCLSRRSICSMQSLQRRRGHLFNGLVFLFFCCTAVVHFSGFMVQDHVSCVDFQVPCFRFSCPEIVLQFMLYGVCSKFSRLRLFALDVRLWLWSCCRLRPPLVASCQALEFVFELRLQYSWLPAL